MNDTIKARRISNPRLTLYAFHLRNDLFQVVADANSLWGECVELGKQHNIEPLKSLPENLLGYTDGKYQPEFEDEYARKNNQSTKSLPLRRNEQLRNFEVTLQSASHSIEGTVDPVRLHDTYALDLTLGYAEAKVAVEPAELSSLNLLPSQLHPSLGRTLLLIVEPPDYPDDYSKLAQECVSALLKETTQVASPTNYADFSRLVETPGQLFGSPIFEYDVSPADPKQSEKHCHILVCFNRHPKTKEILDDELAYWDLLQLLCCRTKILYAHHQAQWCNHQARQIYGSLEEYSQGLNHLEPEPGARLKKLKDLLAKMAPKEFEYASYRRDLEAHLTTICTNVENYKNCLEAIQKKSQKFVEEEPSQNLPKENLGFLANFLDRSESYRRQIEVDLSYLVPGQALFQQLLSTIRGIVEIEQAEAFHKKEEAERERDRQYLQQLRAKEEADKQRNDQLQTTIYIISAGLGGGALVASNSGLLTVGSDEGKITVQWWPVSTSLPIHPFSVAVGISIISALVFGGAAWALRKFIQLRLDNAAKKELEAFIKLLTTQPNKVLEQERENLGKLVATLPNDVQALSEAIDNWCQSEGRSQIHTALLDLKRNLPKNNRSKKDKDYKKRLLEAIVAPTSSQDKPS